MFKTLQQWTAELKEKELANPLLINGLHHWEVRMSRISFIIVIVFILCHIPRMVPVICDFIWPLQHEV